MPEIREFRAVCHAVARRTGGSLVEFRVVDAGPLTFLDVPDLHDTLAAFPGLRGLTKADLDARFTAADWPHLTTDDIRYWRPATVGEALFNYWD